MNIEKIETWSDLIEAWVEARFGYTVHALRILIGFGSITIPLEYFYPGYLINKTFTFSNPMPVAEFLGWLLGSSTILLIFYYAGKFWIDLGKAIIQKRRVS